MKILTGLYPYSSKNIRLLLGPIVINDILNYFDEGGNLVIVGDVETSKAYRKLFRSFGVELDTYVFFIFNIRVEIKRPFQ